MSVVIVHGSTLFSSITRGRGTVNLRMTRGILFESVQEDSTWGFSGKETGIYRIMETFQSNIRIEYSIDKHLYMGVLRGMT